MNNINMQPMEKFITDIQEDPSQAKKHKQVTGSWMFAEGETQFGSKLDFAQGSIVLHSELAPFAGGWGANPDPVQYCLFGLAACFAGTLAATAATEGIQFSRLEVSAENWMDLRKQMGVGGDNIIDKVKFSVSADGVAQEDLDRLVDVAKERCPGVECITQKIALEYETSI